MHACIHTYYVIHTYIHAIKTQRRREMCDLPHIYPFSLQAAVAFCASVPAGGNIDEAAFNEACGVGIVVSLLEIQTEVERYFTANKADIEEKRYAASGPILTHMRKTFKWADQKHVKDVVETKLLEVLGPKDDRDDPVKVKGCGKRTSMVGDIISLNLLKIIPSPSLSPFRTAQGKGKGCEGCCCCCRQHFVQSAKIRVFRTSCCRCSTNH